MGNRHYLQDKSCLRLERMVKDILYQMNDLGYSQRTIQQYTRRFQEIKQFVAEAMDTDCYTSDLAERFIKHMGYSIDAMPSLMSSILSQTTISLRMLSEYATYGCVHYTKHPDRRLALPEEFQTTMTFYEQHRVMAGDCYRTIKGVRKRLSYFLVFLQDAGFYRLSDIKPVHISDFLVAQSHRTPHSMGAVSSVVRGFLHYLYQHNIIDRDLSDVVPSIRRHANLKVPTIWSKDEIQKMLEQVDRNSPVGKRDYAILLIAIRLGIRAGDIGRMSLDDINWENRSIECSQSKTYQRVLLPLPEDVGWALIDYLKNGRPESQCREIFLRCNPPHRPFAYGNTFHSIVTKYRRMSGISVPAGGRRGIHSLRYSLASNLLAQDIPLSNIAGILGHSSVETTRAYAKVDIKHLRQCAIDPEGVGDA